MWTRLIEMYRNRDSDAAKAKATVTAKADADYREALADYDLFVPAMQAVGDPSIELGTARDSSGAEVPVRIELEDLAHHALVIGGTGVGKTTFVTSLVAQALAHNAPVGVVDFKADFFRLGLEWAAAYAWTLEPDARRDFLNRIVVVNPFADELVPLNVCRPIPGIAPEVQGYNVALALSRLFDTSIGVQTENVLTYLVMLLMEAGLTLAEAPTVLQDEVIRGILVERSQHIAVKDYFLRTWSGVPFGSKEAIISRLGALLLPQNFRLMLGADELADFKGVLDDGDPMFIFLGKNQNAPERQVDVMGSLLLQLLFQATFANSRRRRPYQLCCDEFFHLVDTPALGDSFETALTTLRAYNVHLTLAMHYFNQVSAPLRDAILSNCHLMAIFQQGRSGQFFAEYLPEQDPDIVRQSLRRTGRMPSRHEVRGQLVDRLSSLPQGTCYWFDRRKRYRSILLNVRRMPEPHEAVGLTRKQLEDFMTAERIHRGRLALPKAVLRRQLEERARKLAELVPGPAVPESAPRPGKGSTAGRSNRPGFG